VHDDVVARPVESNSHAGVELDHVVPDAQAVRPHEHEAFHALLDANIPDFSATDVGEIRAGAKAQPLVVLVVVVREPVDQALVFRYAEQPRFPVVAQIIVRERQAASAARHEADLVASDRRVHDPYVPSADDPNSHPRGSIRIGARVGTNEGCTGKVDRKVIAADRDDGGVERAGRGQPVHAGRDAD
jgi:hypothetical protein